MAAVADKPPGLTFPAPLGAEGKPPPEPAKDSPKDSAPKRRGRPPGSGGKNSLSISKIEDGLNEQLTMLAIPVFAFNQYDGQVLLEGTPRLAKALASLCEKNPKVKRNIERILTGGSYGEIVIAAGLIAIPIMANHGLMPGSVQTLYGAAIPPDENANGNGHSDDPPA